MIKDGVLIAGSVHALIEFITSERSGIAACFFTLCLFTVTHHFPFARSRHTERVSTHVPLVRDPRGSPRCSHHAMGRCGKGMCFLWQLDLEISFPSLVVTIRRRSGWSNCGHSIC